MKIIWGEIDHIQLCVPQDGLELARQFYLHLLGFQEVDKPDSLKGNGGFWCEAGEISLHIGVEKHSPLLSKRHPAFIVQNLKNVRDYLHENGIQVYEETPIPKVERFSIRDPFGNRIELLEYTLTTNSS